MIDEERQIYITRYSEELERRASVNDRVDAMITLLSLFAGLAVYYVLNFPPLALTPTGMAFIIFFCLLASGTILSGVFIAVVIWNDRTCYLPNPEQSYTYFRKLEEYHIELDPIKGLSAADREIREESLRDHIAAAQTNAQRNDSRDWCLMWSKRMIFLALIGAILSSVPYVYMMSRTPPITRVQIAH